MREEEIYRKFGDEYIKILINELKILKKNASGKLINSVSYELKEISNKINILINSEEYLEYIDKGRKPGSYPPFQNIKKWTELRGINKKVIFPIMKNIYKYGIKPTNILDKVENKMNKKTYLITNEMIKYIEKNIKL